jgi:hypothetical protein
MPGRRRSRMVAEANRAVAIGFEWGLLPRSVD